MSNTQGCQYTLSGPSDNGETTVTTFVNQQEFFENTDWLYGGSLTESGGQSGTWNIASLIDDDWDDVLLIFKNGSDTGLVGYWVDDGATSGIWSSPFREPPFDFTNNDQIRDVSYLRVFYTTGPGGGEGEEPGGKVPEPATLGLLGIGLIGLFAMRRRRQ